MLYLSVRSEPAFVGKHLLETVDYYPLMVLGLRNMLLLTRDEALRTFVWEGISLLYFI